MLNYRITDTAGFGRRAVSSMEDTAGRTTETAETSAPLQMCEFPIINWGPYNKDPTIWGTMYYYFRNPM